jgi:hypothetical protein
MLAERCKIFAEAYNNLDSELLIDALAEDCVYESQKVLAPLTGKSVVNDFIRGKFKTIKARKAFVTASVRRVCRGAVFGALGQPCVVLNQGDVGAVVLLELSDEGKIKRIDICIVPGPADTRPLDDDGRLEATTFKSFAP